MEKDIGKINKNDTTDIVIRIDDFADKRGLTIREFVTSDRYTGFTKSGVRIMAEDFLSFREMINSISLDDMKPIEGGAEKAQEKLADADDNKAGTKQESSPKDVEGAI